MSSMTATTGPAAHLTPESRTPWCRGPLTSCTLTALVALHVAARPQEYEDRVITFFDRTLLGTPG